MRRSLPQIASDLQHIDELVALFGPVVDTDPTLRSACALAWEVRDERFDHLPRSMEVAELLMRLGFVDTLTLRVALLSDPRLRGRLSERDIEGRFGSETARLVSEVNRINTFHEYNAETLDHPKQRERLRRMLLAMVQDVRVIMIKLAFRVQRLRHIGDADTTTQRHVARETLEVFAPIANRLGLGQVKWELEDLAFRYLDPDAYRAIATALDERRSEREGYIEKAKNDLRETLAEQGIEAEVSGRPKHIYSIWRKMQTKHLGLDELFDLRAIRIHVDTVPHCYQALGLVHGLWHHIPKEFDDYIANPKANGYQSLHTAVFGPENKVLEVQIRTHAMHEAAERGIAAHWRYKEGAAFDAQLEETIGSLRRLLEGLDENKGEVDLRSVASALVTDRVYVLTPKGEILEFPEGATTLDFAYAIHTEVGHRCRGAKVNGRIVPLNHTLRTGDRVEILTAKSGGPSRDWLNTSAGYLRTHRALAKVRQWFNQQAQDEARAQGRQLLERACAAQGVKPDGETLATELGYRDKDELMIALGRGQMTRTQVGNALKRRAEPTVPTPAPSLPAHEVPAQPTDDVHILGVGNLLTQVAQCCRPVPGDPIVGYITQGRGVMIHRRDCPNLKNLPEHRQMRLVEVSWGELAGEHRYPAALRIVALDRTGLLRDIGTLFAEAGINVLRSDTLTNKDDSSAVMQLTVEIRNTDELDEVLRRVDQLPNVLEVNRLEQTLH